MRASAGSGRGVLVAPDDIAAVSVTARMPREDAHQFLSGIAGGAGNGDAGQGSVGRRSRGRRSSGVVMAICIQVSGKRIFIHSNV